MMTPIRAVTILTTAALAPLAGPLGLPLATPLQAQDPQPPVPVMFQVAGPCMACHNGITSPVGEDVSFGTDWRASMMANAARDPYWQAAVRRETLDHPDAAAAIQDECSKCHMPMMRYQAHAAGGMGEVFANAPSNPPAPPAAPTPASVLAADGVSCTVCHQIQPAGFGEEESFTGGFHIDTETPAGERPVYGPYEVAPGVARGMLTSALYRPTRSEHVRQSELCATCHTLYTHARSAAGEVVGELPEQVPYLEWRHSDYAEERACQACHMPVVADATPISSVLPTPRTHVSRHVFRGGNFFMPRVLNAFRTELGVTALPAELDAVSMRTEEHLRTRTARLAVSLAGGAGAGDDGAGDDAAGDADGRLAFDVAIQNLAGHKLPTAYPSRRAWLHVTVTDAGGRTVFESGSLRPDGSIVGNDNDGDAGRWEPHHAVIESPDQVQVYEAIMVDDEGRVTTGLLRGRRYIKDNRLLPRGFDKATAEADVAVHGGAADDADFGGGGERVSYRVDVAGAARPLEVRAELWYQPVGFRWARNLDGLGTVETDRFVRYYDALSAASATRLAEAATMVP